MAKPEIAQHNESLAIQKIRDEYIKSGLVEAMSLCQDYMGIGTVEAYSRVKILCEEVQNEAG